MENNVYKTSRLIFNTILGVLKRPRFGINVGGVTVDPNGTKFQCQIDKDGFFYLYMVYAGRNSTSVSVQAIEEYAKFGVFFTKTVKHNKLPNLRTLGTTIGNKVKMRVIHSVMNG